MAVKIPQYQQQTAPNSLGVVPVARGVDVSDAEGRAGQRLAGAMQGAIATYDQVQRQIAAEKKRQEEEDAKAWTASTIAKAAADQSTKLAELQETAAEGAADFTQQFNDQFDEYEQTALSLAPNDTARKFLGERFLALRSELTGRALAFEVDERRRWRINTTKSAIDTVASTMAADPSRLPVALAEQRAIIDAMDVPPEQRRALHDYLNTQVSTAAVLGEIKRDPERAREALAARLGVDAVEAAGAGAPSADVVWQRIIRQESGGRQFGKGGQPLTSKAGAVGIAQVMPETGPIAARYANLPWDPVRFRTDAHYNAALGRAYFDQQMRDFGHPALAAAAYNAGPGAVKEWIGRFGDPRKGEISYAEFAAKIPYKETREYVAAVAPPSLSVQQAAAAKPEGERVGSQAYDLLPVPTVVQLLGSVNQELEKQRAQFRSYVASREADDLAAFGDGKQPPQPLSAGEFISAYGEVEGLQRWERYKGAQSFATELAGLATKTPAEIAAIVKAREPKPGEGYADQAKLHGALVQAAGTVLQRRADDPIAFAIGTGLSNAQPLNLQDPEALATGLKERVGLAETMAGKYGTRYTLLTKDEATQMSARLQAMTAPEKAQFLQTVRGSLPDPRAYHSIMSQLRPDSPVTATAGSLMAVGGEVKLGKDGMFSDAPRMSATQVAQRVLLGEDLLNPAKGDKAADGKPKFPMPPDSDLRRVWTEYVGSAYAGAPDTEAASYQAFRAFYAAELANAGDYSGKFNERAAEIAAAAVTGGVADVNGSKIVLPWGVSENYVRNELRQNWQEAAAAIGIGMVPFEAVDLRTVGDGVYAVMAGTGPLRDKNGRQVFLRVRRPSRSSVPEAPTPGYQLGMAP